MKKLLLFLLFCCGAAAQNLPFKEGEWLRYNLKYNLFPFLTAAKVTIEVKNTQDKEIKQFISKGYTVGIVNSFFEVKDTYETFFNVKTLTPKKFIRNVYEGGHTINRVIEFDLKNDQAKVFENGKDSLYVVPKNVQDVFSLMCLIRILPIDKFKIGKSIDIPVFVDKAIFKFKLKLIDKETIDTKFGKTPALVFKPFVKKGRIFKEEEGVKIWVSNDKNKIPLKFEIEITVGSIQMELDAFKGLSHPIQFYKDLKTYKN